MANAFAVSSLMAQVHPEEPVRSRAETAEQEAHRLLTALGLDRELYDVLTAVETEDLDAGAQRVLTRSIRDFRRAGVDQDEGVRNRLRELSERETEVAQEFSKNIRDGVRTISLDAAQLDGLPADYIAAHAQGADGSVELTTAYPDYVRFMTFGRDRNARRTMVEAFLNRAWPENDPLLKELLALRQEHATILGYAGWPSYDAEVKMIGEGTAIPEFIDRISAASAESARRDYDVLLERLRADHPDAATVDSTDKSFYSEVIRRENFDVDAQQVREYFAFDKVRSGLLEVTGRLSGSSTSR